MQTEAAAPQAAAGDLELLASIIFCEAGNQPYEGQVAVGAVILKPCKQRRISGQYFRGHLSARQFGPAMTGWLDSVLVNGGYTDTAMQAAADALAGSNPIGDCLDFETEIMEYKSGDHFFH